MRHDARVIGRLLSGSASEFRVGDVGAPPPFFISFSLIRPEDGVSDRSAHFAVVGQFLAAISRRREDKISPPLSARTPVKAGGAGAMLDAAAGAIFPSPSQRAATPPFTDMNAIIAMGCASGHATAPQGRWHRN